MSATTTTADPSIAARQRIEATNASQRSKPSAMDADEDDQVTSGWNAADAQFVFGAPEEPSTSSAPVQSVAVIDDTATAKAQSEVASVASAAADAPFVYGAPAVQENRGPTAVASHAVKNASDGNASAARGVADATFVFGAPAAATAGGSAGLSQAQGAAATAGAAPDDAAAALAKVVSAARAAANAPFGSGASARTMIDATAPSIAVASSAAAAAGSPFVFGAPAAVDVVVPNAAFARQADAGIERSKPMATGNSVEISMRTAESQVVQAKPLQMNADDIDAGEAVSSPAAVDGAAAAPSPFVFGAPENSPDASPIRQQVDEDSDTGSEPTVGDDFAEVSSAGGASAADAAGSLVLDADYCDVGEDDMNGARQRVFAAPATTTHSAKSYEVSAVGKTVASFEPAADYADASAEFSIADSVRMEGWGVRSASPSTAFSVGEGELGARVQNLVEAMASFAPPAAGETTLTSKPMQLDATLAASWQ